MSGDADEAPLTDEDYRLLARFRHALRAFLRFSEQAARDAGLTPAEHQLLLAVKGHPSGAPAPLSDVAEMLQLKRHSVVELVDRAAANGLLTRRADPEDRRRALLELTHEGEACLRDLSVLHRAELRRFDLEMREVLGELER